MRVQQSLLFFSLAAFAMGGAAWAQDRDQTFQQRDTNNDGVLTQGEYGGHPGNFRSLDVDGDGVLSYDEFVRRGGRVDESQTGGFADPFAVMDRNYDGKITAAEWQGDRYEFRRLDRNRDGVVSRWEFNNANSAPVGTSDDPAVRRFRALDRNRDGRLSRSEARMRSADFSRSDVDRNGVLTVNEYVNAPVSYGGGDQFDVMDRNNDGVVSSREWRGHYDTFRRLDRNRDKVLTRNEYMNQRVGLLDSVLGGLSGGGVEDRRFRELDENNDGIISSWEWQGDTYEFERLDSNNDGVVSLSEFIR